ncbi:MAG: hypothetical protein DHS20C18_16740 [Saprospiraceae bacterium]|nr:MAG: hypothetical protein DHS20C18_16740 [Saprospiraceae bacterium]
MLAGTVLADVVITEIMYNPPESGTDSLEYIELYNNGSTAVNLIDYSFTSGVTYTFPGFNLGAGEYVIVAVDSVKFENNFGVAAFQWVSGGLSNGGELIQLSDGDGNIVDEVDYSDGGAWPIGAAGGGASLVLCDVMGDNTDPANWQAASTATGVISNGLEVFANPGGASECIGGPIVYFIDDELDVSEEVGTVSVRLAIENNNGSNNSVMVIIGAGSTATSVDDYTYTAMTVNFDSGAVQDTQTVQIGIIDDVDIESIETIVLELSSPSAGVAIDPVRSGSTVSIGDNDAVIPNIVISEIMYNNSGTDDYEFIELYNNDSGPVNMNGFYFGLGVVDTIPNITMQPGDYLIIAVDSALFEAAFGFEAFQWDSGALNNSGETIELRDAFGNVVDVVTYDDEAPWPQEPDGGGNSLILCDPSADNEDPANWSASFTNNGVIINGSLVLASPGESNDCTPPEPSTYPAYDIGVVTTNNANGVPDSIGVTCQLKGIVYGDNLRPGGLQFTLIDGANDGIHIFSNSVDFGYIVEEGDEVIVRGTIAQFSGLTQMELDTVWAVSIGNSLFDPTDTDVLDETTESQLVRITGLTIVDPVQWTNEGTGFNVDVTDGTNTYAMRIDGDVNIFGTDPPAGAFNLTGIGGQFDGSSPFDEGYQIVPRYIADIDLINATIDPSFAEKIRIYPNPVGDYLNIDLSTDFDRIGIRDVLGKTMVSLVANSSQTIDLSSFAEGMYFVTFVKGNSIWTSQFAKQ